MLHILKYNKIYLLIFAKAVQKTIKLVVKELLEEVKTISEIITTGHSLGGALAVLCAYDLSEEFQQTTSDLYDYRVLEEKFKPHGEYDDLEVPGKTNYF